MLVRTGITTTLIDMWGANSWGLTGWGLWLVPEVYKGESTLTLTSDNTTETNPRNFLILTSSYTVSIGKEAHNSLTLSSTGTVSLERTLANESSLSCYQNYSVSVLRGATVFDSGSGLISLAHQDRIRTLESGRETVYFFPYNILGS